MKRALAPSALLASFGVACLVVACAGGTPSAENTAPAPTVSATSVTPVASTPAPVASASPSAAPSDAGSPPPGVDAAGAPSCGGADVDLLAVLANRRCRPDRDAPATPASAAKDVHVTLTPSAKQVAPGGHVDLDLVVENTGSVEIPLYFSGDLTLAPVVTDAKKKRITPPAGNAPKASDPKCHEVDCRHHTSHVILPPGGKAHARVGWDAVKTAWPKTPPTDCCTVHVDPVAAGPLAAGTYAVKVPLPYETPAGSPPDAQVEIRVAK